MKSVDGSKSSTAIRRLLRRKSNRWKTFFVGLFSAAFSKAKLQWCRAGICHLRFTLSSARPIKIQKMGVPLNHQPAAPPSKEEHRSHSHDSTTLVNLYPTNDWGGKKKRQIQINGGFNEDYRNGSRASPMPKSKPPKLSRLPSGTQVVEVVVPKVELLSKRVKSVPR